MIVVRGGLARAVALMGVGLMAAGCTQLAHGTAESAPRPASRAELFKKIKALEIGDCPFANLPEKRAGRWGAGLTAAKMAECRWLKPELVAQFEFVEWTDDAHLRHSRFMALRDDKKPRDVRREISE